MPSNGWWNTAIASIPTFTGAGGLTRASVLENSLIQDIPARIQDSLIGRQVRLTRSPIKPKACKPTLGDHSQVGIL